MATSRLLDYSQNIRKTIGARTSTENQDGRSSRILPKSRRGSRNPGVRKVKANDRRIAALLDQVSNAVTRFRARELAPAGISAIEAEVLFTLNTAEVPTTPAEISRWILRGSDSTSRLIQRMEAKGLVQKSKDLERGNLVRVSMTEKGKAAYEISLAQWRIDHPVSLLSDQAKKQLEILLRKMLQGCPAEYSAKHSVPYP
jgi:DNA-binding MarR family transcriptional regulator